MRYSKSLLILSLTLFVFMMSCDDTSQDADPDPEALEFVTEPSDDLAFMIEEAPSDFRWEFFQIISM